jgi:hypothetical protein
VHDKPNLAVSICVGRLYDFWMFNITSNEWTFFNGLGSYGIKGIPSTTNYPGTRRGHSMVIDPTSSCIFLFGGEGFDQAGILGMSKVSWMNFPHFTIIR